MKCPCCGNTYNNNEASCPLCGMANTFPGSQCVRCGAPVPFGTQFCAACSSSAAQAPVVNTNLYGNMPQYQQYQPAPQQQCITCPDCGYTMQQNMSVCPGCGSTRKLSYVPNYDPYYTNYCQLPPQTLKQNEKTSTSLGIAALVCDLFSLAPVALVLSIIGLVKACKSKNSTGKALNIIALAISVFSIASLVFIIYSFLSGSFFESETMFEESSGVALAFGQALNIP